MHKAIGRFLGLALILSSLSPNFAAHAIQSFSSDNNWSDLTDDEVCALSWGLDSSAVEKEFVDDFAEMIRERGILDCVYFDFNQEQPGSLEFKETGLPHWCRKNLDTQSTAICRAAQKTLMIKPENNFFSISLDYGNFQGDFEFYYPSETYYPFSIKSMKVNNFALNCSAPSGEYQCTIQYPGQKLDFNQKCARGGEYYRTLKLLNFDFRENEWSFYARDRHQFGYLDGDAINKDFTGYWGFFTDYYEPNMSPAFFNEPIFTLIQHNTSEQDTLVLYETNCASNFHFFNLNEPFYEMIPNGGNSIPKFVKTDKGLTSHIIHKGGQAFYCCGACNSLELDLTNDISFVGNKTLQKNKRETLKKEFLKEHHAALNEQFDLQEFNLLAALLDKHHRLYQNDVCLEAPWGDNLNKRTETEYFLLKTLLKNYAANFAHDKLFNKKIFEKRMIRYEKISKNKLMREVRLELQRSVDF